MSEPLSALDRIAEVFATIDSARAYGFSMPAAMDAATEHLAGLDRNDLLAVASTLAALIAVDLEPAGSVSMDWWAEAYAYLLACRERES